MDDMSKFNSIFNYLTFCDILMLGDNMGSRMDKYEMETPELKKRTERNKKLYDSYDIGDYDKFDINSNVEVLKSNARNIDVNQIKDMLDKKYRDNLPQRKSIDLPIYEDVEVNDPLEDTKEYDLNSILSKVKEERTINYDNLRLNTTSSSKELVDNINKKYANKEVSDEEEELQELINTITSLELKNQKQNADLLGLSDDEPSKTSTSIIPKKPENEFYTGKLSVTDDDLDDFKDMQDDIKSNSIFIKVLVFIIILIFIGVGIYVANNVFELGLF